MNSNRIYVRIYLQINFDHEELWKSDYDEHNRVEDEIWNKVTYGIKSIKLNNIVYKIEEENIEHKGDIDYDGISGIEINFWSDEIINSIENGPPDILFDNFDFDLGNNKQCTVTGVNISFKKEVVK